LNNNTKNSQEQQSNAANAEKPFQQTWQQSKITKSIVKNASKQTPKNAHAKLTPVLST
jgi:hypothetical protein